MLMQNQACLRAMWNKLFHCKRTNTFYSTVWKR